MKDDFKNIPESLRQYASDGIDVQRQADDNAADKQRLWAQIKHGLQVPPSSPMSQFGPNTSYASPDGQYLAVWKKSPNGTVSTWIENMAG